ncbi:cytidine deaminase [Ruminococcaceae bacterium OttesenSCG-928-N02]|nr:cytidine deaminase [Ruminococcaceae bacterium OttesenSCG-928-N02]
MQNILTDEQIQALLSAAWQGAANAYSPYSHFAVGAAVWGADGKIYTGCNVENISFGLTNCAERTAIFSMVAAGCKKFTAIAIVANSDGITAPCGACRQVMVELAAGAGTPVYLANKTEQQTHKVGALMPIAFSEFEANG